MALNFLLKRSGTANKRPDPASMVLGELDLNYDATTGGVFYKDSNGDVVKVGSAQVSATAPNATPAGSAGNSDGEFWYDTSNTTLKIWNGSAWVSISGGGGGVAGVTGTAPITVDNTDPANPVVGVDAASTSTSGVVQLNDSTSSTSTTEAATANTVKTAYDAGIQGQTDAAAAQATADAAVPDASYTALGAILTGTGAGTYAALTLGTNTNVLTADSACAGGVKWAAGGGGGSGTVTDITAGTGLTGGTITTTGTIALDATCVIAPTILTAKGSLISASAASTPTALAVGTNGQVLTACSTCTSGLTWTTVSGGGIASVTGTAPITVDNTDAANPIIGVSTASTSAVGVVQLNDSTTSTSTTEALTANQGKSLQDQIDALAVTTNITLGGTYNANTGLVNSVTTQGTTAGLVVGNALPAPGPTNDEIFVIVDVQGTNGPNSPTVSHVGDWFLSNGTTWQFLNVGFAPGQATTTSQGVVELATDAEVQAGTDSSNAVVSSSLQSKLSNSTSTTSSTTIASSTAVKSAYDAGIQGQTDAATAQGTANAALPKAGGTMTGNIAFQDAGEGVVFSGGSSIIAISDATGNTNSDVAASSTAVKNAYALADAAVPKACYTALGALAAGTGASTVGTLPIGTNGQVLTADSACTSGLKWAAAGGGSGTVTSITAGTGLTGGTITTSGTVALDTSCVVQPSVLTAKGNLIVATAASTPAALPVGTDGQVLTANSACASGVAWAAAGGGGSPAAPCSTGSVFGCTTSDSTTERSVSLGFGTLSALTAGGTQNVAIGYQAGRKINGGSNTFIGTCSGGAEGAGLIGSSNIAIGCGAMSFSGTVGNVIAIGASAGGRIQGTTNIAIGTQALYGGNSLTGVGTYNVGIGGFTSFLFTTGSLNVSVGHCTMFGATSACQNVALGFESLKNVTTGTNNLAVGSYSGTTGGTISGLANITTGSNNIVLGNFNHTCAQIKVAWTVTSDERDKAIDPAGVPYGLAFVNQIEPIAYCWCDRATGEVTEDRKRFGFSAQNICALETSTAEPIIVSADDPENLRFTDQMLLPVLVNAIKELSAKNDALEARIALLEGA